MALAGVAVPLAGAVLVLGTDISRWLVAVFLGVAAGAGLGSVLLASRADGYAAELERSRSEFRRAVMRLGEAMGATDDRETLVQVTLEAAMAVAGADTALFWSERAGMVHQLAGVGLGADRGRTVARGEGLVGAVLATGEAQTWPGGPAPAPGEPGARTSVAVPVRARGTIHGVLSVHRSQGEPFDDDERDDIAGLGRQAGAAIDATFLHEETRRLSLTDGLTSLWNRRQFELRGGQELDRAVRFGERFAVVLVDLDSFKAVNDTWGHLVGDAVLVETAQRLVADTRDVDTVARYGGEEFVLLLPQTDKAGAVRVAEKVRLELASAPIDTEGGPLHVTLSAGVASYPDDGTTLVALLAAADGALYAAKAAGKNRVVQAAAPDPGASFA